MTVEMKKLRGQFRSTIWDPTLIISQIFAVQSIFYSCLGLWLSMVNVLTGSNSSLDLLFKYEEIHIHDFGGRAVVAAFILNSLTGAIALWFIVGRTKQCLDFAATTHLLHLIICWVYNSLFPSTISWWLLNAACVTIMCVYGEYLCLKTELQAIPLSVGPKADL
ncbi:Protein SYS1-like protein [Frankliniella fusca]|uniref:Protein SYS1 homolog n=1 Tax=Frankliniella fusca TaxID=407009 RepID=A0AAE1LBA6_9NEOP|nr:Protein SYS1-like protein [Frankliniella fusca]